MSEAFGNLGVEPEEAEEQPMFGSGASEGEPAQENPELDANENEEVEAEAETEIAPEIQEVLDRFGGDHSKMAKAIVEGTTKISELGTNGSDLRRRNEELTKTILAKINQGPDSVNQATEEEAEDLFAKFMDDPNKTLDDMLDRRTQARQKNESEYDSQFQLASNAAAGRLEADPDVGEYFRSEGSFEAVNEFIADNPFLRSLMESITPETYNQINLEESFYQLQKAAALMRRGADAGAEIQTARAEAKRSAKKDALKKMGAATQKPGATKKSAPGNKMNALNDSIADGIVKAFGPR